MAKFYTILFGFCTHAEIIARISKGIANVSIILQLLDVFSFSLSLSTSLISLENHFSQGSLIQNDHANGEVCTLLPQINISDVTWNNVSTVANGEIET